MRIIEKTTVGKRSQEECEDGILVTDDFAAAIDGSTSKTSKRVSDDMSNGRFCMLTVADELRSTPPDCSAEDFCKAITERIRGIYISNGIRLEELEKYPVRRMAASAVIFSSARHQVWMIGDCQCMIDGKLYDNPKPQESVIARRRAEILKEKISEGMSVAELRTDDIGRKAILQDIINGCQLQNVAYSVIDGFPIPMQYVRILKIEESVNEIMLASDGYPVLKPTIGECETELKRLLADDPLCIYECPATKGLAIGQNSFDDRCAVRFAPYLD